MPLYRRHQHVTRMTWMSVVFFVSFLLPATATWASSEWQISHTMRGKIHQIGVPGEWLVGELVVQVSGNVEDNAHIYVCYEVGFGNGKVARSLVRLNQDREASTRWMLGTECGQDTQRVYAYLVDMTTMNVVSDTVEFTARMAEQCLLERPRPLADPTPQLFFMPKPDVLKEPARVVNVSEYQPTILVRNPYRTLVSIIQSIQSSFTPRQVQLPNSGIFSLRE